MVYLFRHLPRETQLLSRANPRRVVEPPHPASGIAYLASSAGTRMDQGMAESAKSRAGAFETEAPVNIRS